MFQFSLVETHRLTWSQFCFTYRWPQLLEAELIYVVLSLVLKHRDDEPYMFAGVARTWGLLCFKCKVFRRYHHLLLVLGLLWMWGCVLLPQRVVWDGWAVFYLTFLRLVKFVAHFYFIVMTIINWTRTLGFKMVRKYWNWILTSYRCLFPNG